LSELNGGEQYVLYNYLLQAVLIIAICIINAKSIISAVKKVLKKFIKK
jgi:hypothetical protein